MSKSPEKQIPLVLSDWCVMVEGLASILYPNFRKRGKINVQCSSTPFESNLAFLYHTIDNSGNNSLLTTFKFKVKKAKIKGDSGFSVFCFGNSEQSWPEYPGNIHLLVGSDKTSLYLGLGLHKGRRLFYLQVPLKLNKWYNVKFAFKCHPSLGYVFLAVDGKTYLNLHRVSTGRGDEYDLTNRVFYGLGEAGTYSGSFLELEYNDISLYTGEGSNQKTKKRK